MRVRKVSSDDMKLYDLTKVKLKTAGNNKVCPVRNISKDTYLDMKTGEVKEKKKSENRYQSPKSVRKSINRLMDLIRCNATDSAKCKWITVTYEDVAEPQGERHGNSWHLHILLIFECTIVKRVDTFFKEKYLRTVLLFH